MDIAVGDLYTKRVLFHTRRRGVLIDTGLEVLRFSLSWM